MPLPGQTDVLPIVGAAELSEVTSSLVQVPDAAQLVGHVLGLIANDAAALLADDAGDAGERLADLNARTALASWDALRQPDEAIRLLELAEAHPLAPRLCAMAALDDVAQLARLTDSATEPATGALAIELAEAWLWRHGDPERAGELADRLLASDLPPAWRASPVSRTCERSA